MAQVTFLPEKLAPIDQKLEEIAAQATLVSRPIRVRIQPVLYDSDRQTYIAWSGLSWTLDLEGVEEGRTLREGLELFLRAFGDPEKQGKALKALKELVG